MRGAAGSALACRAVSVVVDVGGGGRACCAVVSKVAARDQGCCAWSAPGCGSGGCTVVAQQDCSVEELAGELVGETGVPRGCSVV